MKFQSKCKNEAKKTANTELSAIKHQKGKVVQNIIISQQEGMLLNQNQIKIEAINEQYSQKKETPHQVFHITRSSAPQTQCFKKNQKWTKLQNAKYGVFIEANLERMEDRPHKHLWDLYEQMSLFISSRNLRQCKSYHQKMLNKYLTIPAILLAFREQNLVSTGEFLSIRQSYLEKNNEKVSTFKPIFDKFEKNYKTRKQNSDKKEHPTGLEYDEQSRQENYRLKFENFEMPMNPAFSFFQETKSGKNIGKTTKQDWKECHFYFIKWMQKLHELTYMSF